METTLGKSVFIASTVSKQSFNSTKKQNKHKYNKL